MKTAPGEVLSPKGRYFVAASEPASLPPGSPAGNPLSTGQDTIPQPGTLSRRFSLLTAGARGQGLGAGESESQRQGDGETWGSWQVAAGSGQEAGRKDGALSQKHRGVVLDSARNEGVEDAGRRFRTKSDNPLGSRFPPASIVDINHMEATYSRVGRSSSNGAPLPPHCGKSLTIAFRNPRSYF